MQTGFLRKMLTKADSPIRYYLTFEHDASLCLNELLGKEIVLQFTNEINCVYCKRKITKSFNQGYCYPCFKKLARCDSCIIKPELCHFAAGTCREPQWGLDHCMQAHIVYLSQTSNVKVGVTRKVNLPTRWHDQGASTALPIISTQSRLHAGMIEVMLSKHMADKTNWRKMLTQQAQAINLHEYAEKIIQATDLSKYISMQPQWQEQIPKIIFNEQQQETIQYPILEYPSKITSHNPEKNPSIHGKLIGIKGQYLILSTGVINIRKYAGYKVDFTY